MSISERVQKDGPTERRVSVRLTPLQNAFFSDHPTISISQALRFGLNLFIEAMESD